MNPLTKRCTFSYDSLRDVCRKENYIIAAVCGVILGAMLALGV